MGLLLSHLMPPLPTVRCVCWQCAPAVPACILHSPCTDAACTCRLSPAAAAVPAGRLHARQGQRRHAAQPHGPQVRGARAAHVLLRSCVATHASCGLHVLYTLVRWLAAAVRRVGPVAVKAARKYAQKQLTGRLFKRAHPSAGPPLTGESCSRCGGCRHHPVCTCAPVTACTHHPCPIACCSACLPPPPTHTPIMLRAASLSPHAHHTRHCRGHPGRWFPASVHSRRMGLLFHHAGPLCDAVSRLPP